MRCVLQRVTQAQVIVNQKTVGEIAHGFVLLLGVTHADTQKDVESLVEKIVKLRLFADPGSNTFMEKSI